ncbi:MAG: response regulator [Planctomycetes bacterium]|nr:response regulator [Planctomycetota bacterium]
MSIAAVGRPLEILLIEDSLIDARLTITALRKGLTQHRLTLVFDGEEALQFVKRSGVFARAPRPDIILLDLLLPTKDGFEVLRELKSTPDLATIPVIVMTSSDAATDREKCQVLRVDDYVTKPVNLEKFLDVMKRQRKHLQDDVIFPAAR